MATESDEEIRSVTCVLHPKSSKDFYFCVDCSRVFCADCRAIQIERVNHLTHRTLPLHTVLTQRQQRMPAIRQLIGDYTNKHDALLSALLKLEDATNTQIQQLNGIVDDFAAQLCREVDNLRTEAKATIAKRAADMCSANAADIRRQQIAAELKRMRDVRADIEHEVRLCERDKLYSVEKNRELESCATELSDFVKKTYAIPDASSYELRDLRDALLESRSLMKSELNRVKKAFLKGIEESFAFRQSERLSVESNAEISFPSEKLTLPNDSEKFPFLSGAIPVGDMSEAMYFVDWDNSKIKLLDLKTSQLEEVFSGPTGTHLNGLAHVEENANGPLIASTEHTKGTSKTVRALFLRRNSRSNAAGRLEVVQSVTLNSDVTGYWTTFAPFAGGNVFCAINGSRSLHELCRSSGESAAFFENTARKHRLPEKVHSVCSLQSKSSGDWRLAAAFLDATLRVFGVAGGTLRELQRIPQPHADWYPVTLVPLPDDSLMLQSHFEDPSNSKWSFGIECSAAQPDGSLAAPERLHSQTTALDLLCLLPPTHSFPHFRLVAYATDKWGCSIGISVYPVTPKTK